MNSLRKISDGSLDDIVLPNVFDEWSQIDVKEEFLEEFDSLNYHVEIDENNVKVEKVVNSRNATKLSKHQNNKEKQFKCSICDDIFKTSRERQSHFASNHKGMKPYKCPKCEDKFEKCWERKRHIASNHEVEKPYKCPSCDDKFKTLREKKSHFNSNHKGEKPYRCPSCESQFYEPSNLKEHISGVHEKNKPFLCESCPSAFARHSGLLLHIREVHKKLKPLKCDQCTLCFSRPAGLKQHFVRVHEGKKPEKKFCCDKCDIRFESRYEMRRHIRVKHVLENKSIDETNINEFRKDPEIAAMIDKAKKGKKKALHKEFLCKLCDIKVLFGKRTHIKKYHSGNNIKCPKCDETFNTYVKALNHHINMHERSPCLICGKFFSAKTIGRHIRMAHTANEEKKYKCEHCGKGFVANDKLQDHINTHTGEKPHVCKVCGKGFASLGTHKMHERMHAGYRRTK